MEVVVNSYPIDVLAAHYRVYGEIRTRGDPTTYFNDQNVSTLIVFDATLIPLRQDMRLPAMSVTKLNIPKTEPQIFTLGQFQPAIRPLPKTEQVVCLTDTYLLQGTLHMAQETRAEDAFYVMPGPFFYVTGLDVHSLFPLATEVNAHSELGFIRGSAVRAFFARQDAISGS